MKLQPVIWALISGLVLPTQAFAQESNKPAASSEIAKKIDPGRPASKFFLRNEYRDADNGSETNVLEGLYEFPINDDWAMRIQVPFVVEKSVRGNTDSGIGDITTRFAYKAVTTDAGNSYFVGVENKWDTATDDAVGGGNNTISPVVFGFVKLPKYKLLAFPLLQTVFTIDADDKSRDVTYTLIRPMALRRLDNRYYMFFEPSLYIDHERGHDTTGNFELEFGRFVNNATMMVYARPGTTLWGDNTPFSMDWNFEVGLRYFMR